MAAEGDLIEKTINGKWHIIKKIGSGSFGQVFVGMAKYSSSN